MLVSPVQYAADVILIIFIVIIVIFLYLVGRAQAPSLALLFVITVQMETCWSRNMLHNKRSGILSLAAVW